MPPKDDKPPPVMGPGSKIKSLIDALKKHLIITEDKKKRVLTIDFTAVGFKTLPVEICKNEEIIELAQVFYMPFNKLKKLPGNIDELRFLRYMDMRSNQMNAVPASFFKIEGLEYVSWWLCKSNGLLLCVICLSLFVVVAGFCYCFWRKNIVFHLLLFLFFSFLVLFDCDVCLFMF